MYEKKKERQVRVEVKKRLDDEKELDKENIEILERNGNIFQVKITIMTLQRPEIMCRFA